MLVEALGRLSEEFEEKAPALRQVAVVSQYDRCTDMILVPTYLSRAFPSPSRTTTGSRLSVATILGRLTDPTAQHRLATVRYRCARPQHTCRSARTLRYGSSIIRLQSDQEHPTRRRHNQSQQSQWRCRIVATYRITLPSGLSMPVEPCRAIRSMWSPG